MPRITLALTIACLIGLTLAANKPSLPSRWSAVLSDATSGPTDPSNPSTVWVDNSNPKSLKLKSMALSYGDSWTYTDLLVDGIEYSFAQNTSGGYICQYGPVGQEDLARLSAILNFMNNAEYNGLYGANSGSCSMWINMDTSGNFVGGCFSYLNNLPMSLSVGSTNQYFQQDGALVSQFTTSFSDEVFAEPDLSLCKKVPSLSLKHSKRFALF